MSTSTLPARSTPLAAVPLQPAVVREIPGEARPFVVGTYLRGHSWSPLLAFTNPLEAVIYAAATNRRTGRWTK